VKNRGDVSPLPANSASPKVSWALSARLRLGAVQSDHRLGDLFRGSLQRVGVAILSDGGRPELAWFVRRRVGEDVL